MIRPNARFAYLAVAGALVLAAASATRSPVYAVGAGYKIDPVHSTLLFRIKHLGVSWFHGRIDDVQGNFTFDPDKPEASSVTAEVKAENVDTHDAQRDDDLRSPGFFAVAQFPTISFRSTAVKKVDATHYDVTGDFTLHGFTKPLTIRMEKGGEGKDPWGGYRMGFEGVVVVRRSEFGMTKMLDGLSDEVTLTIAIEGAKE